MQHTLRTIGRPRKLARQLLGCSLMLCGPFLALSSLIGLATAQGPVGSWSEEFDRPGLHGGWIWALGHYQGDLVAGGEGFFEADGESFGLIARFDGTHWQPIGQRLNGSIVHSFAEFQGELIVGGQFGVTGSLIGNIARWDGSQWRALGGQINWLVYALAEYQGELYAAGDFSLAGGQPAKNIARWDGTQWRTVGGGIDNPQAPGFEEVWALSAGPDDRLYAAGMFTAAGGGAAHNVAVWDGNSWSPVGVGLPGPLNARVLDLEWYQGKLYACGNFDLIGGTVTTDIDMEKVAVWDGSSWSAAGVFPDGVIGTRVSALQTVGTDLYAGGTIIAADGTPVKRFARFDGAQWSAMGGIQANSINTRILDMTEQGGKLVVGGFFFRAGFDFTHGEGIAVDNVTTFDGTDWESVGEGLGLDERSLDSVLWNNQVVVVGGAFGQAGSQTVGAPALFDGTDWVGLGQFLGSVVTVIVDQGDLVVAGDFSSVDGQSANDVARFDGTQWTGFGPPPFCCGVDALAAYQGQIYAGGLGGVKRWNGSSWQTFGPQIFGSIYTLHVHQGVLYIGGSMSSFGNLVAWDGSVQQTVGGGTNGIVYTLESFEGELLVGGSFTSAGGVSANRLARWDGSSFSSFPGITGSLVAALTVFQGELHAGGHLTQAVIPRQHLARWDGSAWKPVGGGLDNTPRALVPDDAGGHLYAAGTFRHAGGSPSSYFARWDTEPGSIGTNFCSSLDNSSGGPAVISGSGSDSVSANDLALSAAPVPDQFGVFFYGPSQTQVPFGNGFRCADGVLNRLAIVMATGNTLTLALDNTSPPTASGQITVGATWNFQAWFRDPAAGGAFFNLSDGLEVLFTP